VKGQTTAIGSFIFFEPELEYCQQSQHLSISKASLPLL